MYRGSSPVTALSIYRDMSGIIRFCSASSSTIQTSSASRFEKQQNFDDFDDLLLYGDTQKKRKFSYEVNLVIRNSCLVISKATMLFTWSNVVEMENSCDFSYLRSEETFLGNCRFFFSFCRLPLFHNYGCVKVRKPHIF